MKIDLELYVVTEAFLTETGQLRGKTHSVHLGFESASSSLMSQVNLLHQDNPEVFIKHKCTDYANDVFLEVAVADDSGFQGLYQVTKF